MSTIFVSSGISITKNILLGWCILAEFDVGGYAYTQWVPIDTLDSFDLDGTLRKIAGDPLIPIDFYSELSKLANIRKDERNKANETEKVLNDLNVKESENAIKATNRDSDRIHLLKDILQKMLVVNNVAVSDLGYAKVNRQNGGNWVLTKGQESTCESFSSLDDTLEHLLKRYY